VPKKLDGAGGSDGERDGAADSEWRLEGVLDAASALPTVVNAFQHHVTSHSWGPQAGLRNPGNYRFVLTGFR